jgi:hypothetical protein
VSEGRVWHDRDVLATVWKIPSLIVILFVVKLGPDRLMEIDNPIF